MKKIAVKQCCHNLGSAPRFYATIGDAVLVQSKDGKSYLHLIVEDVAGSQVIGRDNDNLRYEIEATAVVGVFVE